MFTHLGLRFGIRSGTPELHALADLVFGERATTLAAESVDRGDEYWFVGVDGDPPKFVVEHNGERIATTGSVRFALDYLVWHVNQRVIAASTEHLLLHAGCVVDRDRAIVVAAPSGGGKSTFVAALVRAGCAYATDECVAIDPRTGHTTGYARAIGLKAGSWPFFPELTDAAEASDTYETPNRYATAATLGSTTSAAPAEPAVLCFPERHDTRAGADVLSPIGRADAIVRLAEQSFNFDAFGTERLPLLARVAAASVCCRVDVTDLERAVDAVRALVAQGAVT